MSILEELWYGNIDPMEAVGSGGHYYNELMGLMARNREKITDKLDENMQEVLEIYDDNIRKMDSIAEKEAFIYGIQIGECFFYISTSEKAVNWFNCLLLLFLLLPLFLLSFSCK